MCIHSVMPISLEPHGLHPTPSCSVHRVLRKNTGWFALPFSRDVPNPELNPGLQTQADSLPVEPPGKPTYTHIPARHKFASLMTPDLSKALHAM